MGLYVCIILYYCAVYCVLHKENEPERVRNQS